MRRRCKGLVTFEDYQCDLVEVRASWPNKAHFVPAVDLAQTEPQLRDRELDRACPGVPLPLPIAVTPIDAVRAAGTVLGTTDVSSIDVRRLALIAAINISAYLQAIQPQCAATATPQSSPTLLHW